MLTKLRTKPRSKRDLSRECERVLRAQHLATVVSGGSLLERVRHGIQICKLIEAGAPVGLRTNMGVDALSTNLLNLQQGGAGITSGGTFHGTAGAVTATSITLDFNAPVNALAGQIVVTTSGATRFGVIQSNTSAASSVATIDRWYDSTALPADPGVAAATTPTAGTYVLVAGGAPSAYMALANNATATAPAATDTVLTGEIITTAGGLIRKLSSYLHTPASGGAGTTTLTKTWTANGSDSLPVTVSQIGIFAGVGRSLADLLSRMYFKTAFTGATTATLSASGDQVQVTETVTL